MAVLDTYSSRSETTQGAAQTAARANPAATPRRRIAPAWIAAGLRTLDWAFIALYAGALAALSSGEAALSITLGELLAPLAAAVALRAGLSLAGAYRLDDPRNPVWGAALTLAGAAIAAFACATLGGAGESFLVAHLALTPAAIAALTANHVAARFAIARLTRAGAFAETAIVVGANETARRFIRRARERGELEVIAVFDDRLSRAPSTLEGAPVAGDLDALLEWPGLPHVDQIVISVSPSAEARVRALIAKLRIAPNRIAVLFNEDCGEADLGRIGGTPAAIVSGARPSLRRAVLKRAQDLVIASLMLVAFAPVMAVIAIAVRLDSKGPALFRQQRHGFNNRIITVLKFRSMRNEPVRTGPLVQVKAGDSRVTRLGAFLRSTSLDELPQLFNVIMGDMSLVGPRPHAIDMTAENTECTRIVAEYAHRHRMKPGVTGWAQINGSRGPCDNAADLRERVRLDLEYIERANFWLDLMIILKTAPTLLGDKLRQR